jgi:UDP:flavonoid glycosyltransferase YjiC (YdhE family)
VIRTMTHDQPDNAIGVEGIEIVVSLSPKKFNAASLAEKLDRVITSQQVQNRCKFYAQKVNPEQSLNDTCKVIEDFI